MLLVKNRKCVKRWPADAKRPQRNAESVFMNDQLSLTCVATALFNRFGEHVHEDDMVAIVDFDESGSRVPRTRQL